MQITSNSYHTVVKTIPSSDLKLGLVFSHIQRYPQFGYRLAVTTGFVSSFDGDLQELTNALAAHGLPLPSVDVFPSQTLSSPFPINWTVEFKDRVVLVSRGCKEVGYVTC